MSGELNPSGRELKSLVALKRAVQQGALLHCWYFCPLKMGACQQPPAAGDTLTSFNSKKQTQALLIIRVKLTLTECKIQQAQQLTDHLLYLPCLTTGLLYLNGSITLNASLLAILCGWLELNHYKEFDLLQIN